MKRRLAIAGPDKTTGATPARKPAPTAWDRARRAFNDEHETAFVALGVRASSLEWNVVVDLVPEHDGRVCVQLYGPDVGEVATNRFAGVEGAGFHCAADALESLGQTILDAARGLRELTCES